MHRLYIPGIDLVATGKQISSLRKQRGLSVKDLAERLGFEGPQAVYKWQWGDSLPSIDNLYALSIILAVPMESIIVPYGSKKLISIDKQQEAPAAYHLYVEYEQAG